jgi:hypothetical protein
MGFLSQFPWRMLGFMPAPPPAASETSALIEVHVAVLEQLFYSIDPSPFNARDLDPAAHDYILDCAKDAPAKAGLELRIHVDREDEAEPHPPWLGQAIRTHFAARARADRLRLRELFGRGRISLLIGVAFLSTAMVLANFSKAWLPEGSPAQIVRESLSIGGWVAMWRPMEIFLYDWWPVLARIRLLDRLAKVKVKLAQRRRTGDVAQGPEVNAPGS